MLRLIRAQRAVLLEKVPDVANLAVGALVFGQFLGEEPYSLRLALFGVASWTALMALTFVIAGEEQP